MPPAVEEFIEAARAESTKKDHINNMVTNMNINGHQARVLLDIGTTRTNVLSSSCRRPIVSIPETYRDLLPSTRQPRVQRPTPTNLHMQMWRYKKELLIEPSF
jgi:hypothetical protein